MAILCEFWDGDHYCSAPDARMYLPGLRCPAHTPAAVAGRVDHVPDPALVLEALRPSPYVYRPSDSALTDRRAVASGRRRSNRRTYLLAQAEEARRKR